MRRLTLVAGFLDRLRAQKPEPQPIHRFIAAWENSSAGGIAQFSNHWVIAVREHLDRYRQTVLNATPVAALNGAPPKFAAFDLQAGFHYLPDRDAAVVKDWLNRPYGF